MGSTARVLIVDDEDDLVKMLAEALTLDGYEVQLAYNGREALQLHGEQRADAILTDLLMPVMTGQDMILALRESGDEVPIIVLSGHATLDDARLAIQVGAFDLITKPFVVADVCAVVREAVKVGRIMNAAEDEVLEKIRSGELPQNLSFRHVRAAKQLAFLRRMRESEYFAGSKNDSTSA